ncbi:MAG: polymer-forming cytoskeletal protein [Bacteroidetes bacterium]|nr:MAG: polymer-forming cytoskeletal protein [Bacteroidota bacterium]
MKDRLMSKQIDTPGPVQINMIGEGTTVEGTLRAKDDIRISGRIIGSLVVEGKAIIAAGGEVEGDVNAGDADVAGRIKGEISVKGRLLLKSTARVEGTIRTTRLIVEEGAIVEGKCEMGQLDKNRAKELGNGIVDKESPQGGKPAVHQQAAK